jgi:hypothetical protein
VHEPVERIHRVVGIAHAAVAGFSEPDDPLGAAAGKMIA